MATPRVVGQSKCWPVETHSGCVAPGDTRSGHTRAWRNLGCRMVGVCTGAVGLTSTDEAKRGREDCAGNGRASALAVAKCGCLARADQRSGRGSRCSSAPCRPVRRRGECCMALWRQRTQRASGRAIYPAGIFDRSAISKLNCQPINRIKSVRTSKSFQVMAQMLFKCNRVEFRKKSLSRLYLRYL